ncbi:AAA family ATPase [Streptomyces albidoflavus]|uniref:AAA family ATPase n=1 Tax=Streptomyces albidoflavus TaxID=1886 RepID=UPI00332DE399
MLYVVTGPPAAGKTSWVNEHAQPRDIVIDYDTIAQALAGPGAPTHDHRHTLHLIARSARRAALDEALRHVDRADVYLIHTQPSERSLARYRKHGARIVTLDPGRDVVLERCRTMRTREAARAAERWYADIESPTRETLHPAAAKASRAW